MVEDEPEADVYGDYHWDARGYALDVWVFTFWDWVAACLCTLYDFGMVFRTGWVGTHRLFFFFEIFCPVQGGLKH